VNGGGRLAGSSLLCEIAAENGAVPVRTFLTNSCVVLDAESKRSMAEFGDVVEMESFHVLKSAIDVHVPALAIRAISDVADEDLPLDFGQAIGADGQIKYRRLLRQVGTRLHRVPAMIAFGKRSEKAARNLAGFLDQYIDSVRRRFPLWGAGKEAEVTVR